jgi:hypothetical protein
MMSYQETGWRVHERKPAAATPHGLTVMPG